ncbi:MAG: dihydrofolate reductase family protein, partial [Myxococcota bacterium]|nr:dihydrofolate reductase family protein [Myxococcota bacterium]
VLTRRGVLPMSPTACERWPDPRVNLILLGPHDLDEPSHVELLGAEVVHHPDPSVEWALAVLEDRGCRNVLVEGGGDLMFSLVRRGLLQELFVTICPNLVGGAQAPTMLDGAGFEANEMRALELLESRACGQELFLHYRVAGLVGASAATTAGSG